MEFETRHLRSNPTFEKVFYILRLYFIDIVCKCRNRKKHFCPSIVPIFRSIFTFIAKIYYLRDFLTYCTQILVIQLHTLLHNSGMYRCIGMYRWAEMIFPITKFASYSEYTNYTLHVWKVNIINCSCLIFKITQI